jgi:biopolymer transport protein ExbB/TolQ
MRPEDDLSRLSSVAERFSTPTQNQENANIQVSNDLLELRESLTQEQERVAEPKDKRESEDVAWSSEDSLSAAQRFFSSMALGWGDELGLGLAAAVASVTTGKPVKEVYADMRKSYDAQQEQFKERQGGAAMVADIAGSIASPVNVLRGVQSATKLGQATATGGRVAAESAVYGAGEAKEGERLEGATKGAVSGLVGYGALRSVELPFRAVSRRNIEGDLVDEAGNFVPLTLAAKEEGAEGWLRTFYSDIVAPSFGGKGVITKQEEKVIKPIEDLLKEKDEFTKQLEKGVAARKENLKNDFRQGSKEQTREFAAAKKAAEKQANETIAPLERQIKELSSGKSEAIFARATNQAKEATDSLEHHFRTSAFLESMPARATSKDVEAILAVPNVHGQIQKLDELWNNIGYTMIKDKKIRVRTGAIESAFARMIKEDDYFLVNAVDIPKFRGAVTKVVEKVSQFKDKNGRIDGGKLSELRSELGKLARSSSDPQLRYAFYQTQTKLDNIIKDALTPKQRAQFSKEGGKWKSLIVLRNSIEGTANAKGSFTPDDWIKQINKNNNLDKRYGRGPLRDQAEQTATSISQTQKSIARRASQFAKRKAKVIEQTVRSHKNNLEREIEKLEKTQTRRERGRLVDYEEALERQANNPKIAQMKKEVADLEEKLAELSRLSTYKNPSWFHTLAAHRLLQSGTQIATGATLGGGVGAVGLPVAAAVAGRALASPTVQRIVAGQTAPQMGLQRMLQADATGRTADILARSIGRTGMLTGQ